MSYDFLGRIIERNVELGLAAADRLRHDQGTPALNTLATLDARREAEIDHDLYLNVCNVHNAYVHYRIGLVSGTIYKGGGLPPGEPTADPMIPIGPVAIRFTRDPEGALLGTGDVLPEDLPGTLLLPHWRNAATTYGIPLEAGP